MTAENFDQALRVLQEKRPFQIFNVELNGGERLEIDTPYALVIRDGVGVYVAPGGVPAFFDRNSVNKIMVASANTST